MVPVYIDNEGKTERRIVTEYPTVVINRVLVYTDREGKRQRKIMGCKDRIVLRPVSFYAEGSLPTPLLTEAEQTEEELATEQRQIRWRKRVADVGIFG